jgi:hypothetical protein
MPGTATTTSKFTGTIIAVALAFVLGPPLVSLLNGTIDHSSTRVKFEVVLNHGGYATGARIGWRLGGRRGQHILSEADETRSFRLEWRTDEPAQTGDTIVLAAAVADPNQAFRDSIQLHCNVYVSKDGGPFMPLTTEGSASNTTCSLFAAVP